MKTFELSAREGYTYTTFVDVTLPSPGVNTAKLFATSETGTTAELIGAAVVGSGGVSLTIPSTYLTSANLPAVLDLQVSNASGPYTTIARGRIVSINEANPGAETEIRNDAGNPLIVGGLDKTGAVRALMTDGLGRPRMSLAQPAPTVGSLSAVGSLAANVEGFGSATIFLTGTFTGANVAFEQSPDSTNGTDGNWYPTVAGSVGTNVAASSTGVISTSNAGWEMALAGAVWVRARLSAITTGSVSVTIAPNAASVETAPVIQTHAVTPSGTWSVVPIKTTTNGLTRLRVISAATTNATLVKSTAGNLYLVHLFNAAATPRYIKFYNKATAPVVGTDVPVLTYVLPAGIMTRVSFDALGDSFSAGIGYGITGALVDTDTTAIVANDIVGSIHFA